MPSVKFPSLLSGVSFFFARIIIEDKNERFSLETIVCRVSREPLIRRRDSHRHVCLLFSGLQMKPKTDRAARWSARVLGRNALSLI